MLFVIKTGDRGAVKNNCMGSLQTVELVLFHKINKNHMIGPLNRHVPGFTYQIAF